jgi:isoquinoline 1-oxidoreductase beta subunit
MGQSAVSRRDFLKVSSTAGAGLMIGVFLPAKERLVAAGLAPAQPFEPNAFLAISPDNAVTITVAKSEMGQHVRTSIPMIVADELGADWSQIQVAQADAHPDKYGSQGTGGSGSIRRSFEMLRKAGAAAREMLLEAGAREWGVSKSECAVSKGTVVHRSSGRELTFGALASKAAALPVPDDPPLKDPKDFNLIGKSMPGKDTPSRVNGSAQFGIDIRLPDMLHATVVRCPTFGGKAKSFNSKAAKGVSGVTDIFEIEEGVAVVGKNTWAVIQGHRAANIQWDHGDFAKWDSDRIKSMMEKKGGGTAVVAREEGNVAEAHKKAGSVFEAQYEVPFTHHATMEPMNCVAHVRNGECEIWVPTQVPQRVQTTAAEHLGIPVEKVRVHVTLLGGGFGRRLWADFVTDAVEISQKTGKPVKMLWTREEDMAHDFYRPTSIHKLSAAMTKKNRPRSWSHRVVAPSISGQLRPERFSGGQLDRSAVNGASNIPYEFPSILVDYVMTNTKVPVGWWRSVYNSQNAFANEGFIDELAHMAGMNPLRFRMTLLRNSPRHLGVLQLAFEKSGWNTKLGEGRGRGFAMHESFGSWVANVAEVTVKSDGTFTVDRIVSAIDCGLAVHPDGIRMQMESSIIYGLTSTLKGEITIKRGAVEQSNFHEFELLRIDETPEMEIHIVESDEPPGGAGEPGLPPVAPAVANAIFDATGKRIRKLPIRPEDLRA